MGIEEELKHLLRSSPGTARVRDLQRFFERLELAGFKVRSEYKVDHPFSVKAKKTSGVSSSPQPTLWSHFSQKG